jgi:hypothetical protein
VKGHYDSAQLDDQQCERNLEALEYPDEHVLVVDGGDGQHAERKRPPFGWGDAGFHGLAGLPGRAPRVPVDVRWGKAKCTQLRGNDTQAEAAALGHYWGLRAHLRQQCCLARLGRELKAQCIGDEQQLQPVTYARSDRGVMPAGHGQQREPDVAGVLVLLVPLIKGIVEESCQFHVRRYCRVGVTPGAQLTPDRVERGEQIFSREVLAELP